MLEENDKEQQLAVEEEEEEYPEVEQELSKVASDPKKNMLIMGGLFAAFLYIFYTLFISDGDEGEGQADTVQVPTEVSRPVEVSSTTNLPSIPTLPAPPQLEDPSLPPPPPTQYSSSDATSLPPVESLEAPTPTAAPTDSGPDGLLPPPGNIAAPTLPVTTSTTDEEARRRQEQKRKAPVVLLAGTPPAKTPDEIQQEADFRYRGDMNLMLSRGKMLDAVVESAISTDFGGEVRAVIVRDVYSEWGKNILIPKGSKIFGNYNQGIDGQYGRISIEWMRVDLINGYTINFAGTATDALGRKGIQGRVDNKFKERFANAVLQSAFNVVLANMLDSIVEPQITSQNAAAQSSQATNIRSLANNTNATEETAANARETLCTNVTGAITDKSSSAFTTVNTACAELRATTGGATELEKLASLKNTINLAADSLIQITNQSTELTKAQQASEQAFTDLSDKIGELVEEQELKPTITIDQGTRIKIYVNRDFRFPKAAVGRTRVMK